MARLYVAGVNHFDPFHRDLTKVWLEQVCTQEGHEPAFVANEWSPDAYIFARDHREIFTSCVLSDYEMVDNDSIQKVGESFAYEGDVFDELFGHERSFWLGGSTDLGSLVEFRLKRCHQYVDYQGVPADGADFLQKLSVGAHENAQQPGPGDDRDGKLAALIHLEAVNLGADWAVAILGANHAYRYDSTAIDLLDINHDCRVRIMLAAQAYVDL